MVIEHFDSCYQHRNKVLLKVLDAINQDTRETRRNSQAQKEREAEEAREFSRRTLQREANKEAERAKVEAERMAAEEAERAKVEAEQMATEDELSRLGGTVGSWVLS